MVSLFARRAAAASPAATTPSTGAPRTPLPVIGSIGLKSRHAMTPLDLDLDLDTPPLTPTSSSDNDIETPQLQAFEIAAPAPFSSLAHKSSTFTLSNAPALRRTQDSATSLRQKFLAAEAAIDALDANVPVAVSAPVVRRSLKPQASNRSFNTWASDNRAFLGEMAEEYEVDLDGLGLDTPPASPGPTARSRESSAASSLFGDVLLSFPAPPQASDAVYTARFIQV